MQLAAVGVGSVPPSSIPVVSKDKPESCSSNPVAVGTSRFFKGGKELLNSTDGLTRFSELCLAVLATLSHFLKSVPDAVVRFGRVVETFLDYTAIVSLIKRGKDWLSDDKGVMLWQKAWHKITATACLTGSHIIGFVKFLSTTLKAFELGKFLAPLSFVSNALMVGFGVFDLVGNSLKLRQGAKDKQVADGKLALWEKRAQGMALPEMQTIAAAKSAHWAQKVTQCKSENNPKLAKAERMLAQWTAAQACQNDAEVKTFCNKKVEQLKVVIDNTKTEKTKTAVATAANVLLIALMVLSCVLTFVTPAALALVAMFVAISYSSMDVTEFLTDAFLKSRKVPVIKM